MKITEILNFSVEENCIRSMTGCFFCYRITPPNLTILSPTEKEEKIRHFYGLLSSLDTPLQILAMDKTENMKANKAFCDSLHENYDFVGQAILRRINEIEQDLSGIQRAFYFIINISDKAKKNAFEALLQQNDFKYTLADRSELITMLRNLLLREYADTELYLLENELRKFEAENPIEQENVPVKKKAAAKQVALPELTARLLPERMDINPKFIEQSDFVRKIIMVKNFPVSTEQECLLMELSQIKGTTFVMRLTEMPMSRTAALVNRQINNTIAGGYSKKGTEQIESSVNLEAIRGFYDNFVREKGKIYYLNVFLELVAENPEALDIKEKEVKTLFNMAKITSVDLLYEQREGFQSILPFGKDCFTLSANNVPSSTIAAMYPFSYSSRNDPEGMLLGSTVDGGYLFLDLWERNEYITNSNFVITGESGKGKSYLMKKILIQQIARGTCVYVLDPESEYSTLFTSVGGTVLNCASGRYKINVFEVRSLKTAEDDEEELDQDLGALRQSHGFSQHLSWLQDFFKVLIPYATGKEIAALMTFVKDMYLRRGIDESTDLSSLKREDYPTFTDLYQLLELALTDETLSKGYLTMMTESMIKDLTLMIRDCYDGSLSALFNGITNIPNARLISFNIQELLTGSGERTQAMLFNIMTWIWGKMLKRQDRILFVVDELYLLMNAGDFTIPKYLRNFMKRARKYNAIIGTATQQLGDFLDPAIYSFASTLFNTPAFKFMFDPGGIDLVQIRKLLQLTDGELSCIKDAKKQHCLLKAGTLDKYNVRIGTLDFEDKIFGKGGGK